MTQITRRSLLAASAAVVLAGCTHSSSDDSRSASAEPIIDIHQHTHYHGRSDEELINHQQTMGVTTTILLPAGSYVKRASTHFGTSNGLAAACGGNETVVKVAREHPKRYVFFANEVTDLPEARKEIEKYLKMGALGIGEQKFSIDVESPGSHIIADLAGEYRVPILLHFQYDYYNINFDRFYKVLEKHPKTNFIGHAQTFWNNIAQNPDPKNLYPKGPVARGGLTDKFLSDYPNMFADMSAGSGLNALQRDEDHARWFLEKHQDKILYGSDCDDKVGKGEACQGAQTIAAIRRLAANRVVERKLLFGNAHKMFGIG